MTPGAFVLVAGTGIGLSGVGLFSGAAAGLNVALFAALVAGGTVVCRPDDVRVAGFERRYVALMVLFATTFAWRDSAVLHVLAGIAMMFAYLHVHLAARAKRLAGCGPYEVVIELGRVGSSLLFTTPSLLRREIPEPCLTSEHVSVLRAIARGLAGFVPFALLFGSLLVSADARFEAFAEAAFDLDLGLALRRLAIFVLCSAFAVTVIAAYARQGTGDERDIPTAGWRAGAPEVFVVLGGLSILFTCYIVVQLSYFFGDHALIRGAGTPTYAEYARRGFFQLVWLSILLLPTLLVARWLLRDAGAAALAAFRVIAAILVACVLIIVASAMHRMALYVEIYGLTELRFYCSLFMVWMSVVYAWYCRTELVAGTRRFASGTVSSALAAVALLVTMNPDAIITHTNIHRFAGTCCLDLDYLAALSSDAVPALLESFARGDFAAGGAVVQLRKRYAVDEGNDWRAWNYSRARASELLRDHGAGDAG